VVRDEDRRILEVWNKVDLLDPVAREDLAERARLRGAVAVSAATGEGITALLARIASLIDEAPERTFQLGAADGEALAWLYRHGRVTDRQESEAGLTITARLDPQALGRFEQMRPDLTTRLAAE